MNHIPQRIFWTWDHSTNWRKNKPGSQNCGVANAYTKFPEEFEEDYMRCVDFCAEHKFNAVGIVGLLRDRHGGVDSVRRLCSYANDRGVKIYMIAGTYAYGGIYYEGDHKYSLDRFFEKNPDCVGKTPEGEPLYFQYKGSGGFKLQAQGCASNPKLQEFALESLDWVFREIPELGGIQMESGDCGVCQCEKCRARRGEGTGYISIADMAAIYPAASETIRRVSPDALIICESYSHFTDEACRIFNSENPSDDLKKLLAMPESTYWQWKCDNAVRDNQWKSGDRMLPSLQKFKHIMRAHNGTQWHDGRASFSVENIRKQCQLSFDSGLQCVSMFGEIAPFHANAEFNYLAMEYFADHPHASIDDYITDIMAPRLGGKAEAEYYYEIAALNHDTEKIPAASMKIAKLTAGLTDYEAVRRWQYIASFLNGFYWEAKMSGKTKSEEKTGDIGAMVEDQ